MTIEVGGVLSAASGGGREGRHLRVGAEVLDAAGRSILVVDDDSEVREIVRARLEREGFSVREAISGADALARAAEQLPVLIVLDVVLPDLNGLQVCRRLRAVPATRAVPIIMLTARGDEVDRIVGLELGADDYVTKPFSPTELVARIRAVLRRAKGVPSPIHGRAVERGRIRISSETHDVFIDGKIVPMPRREFELLHFFLQHPNRVFGRVELMRSAWGSARARVGARSVDVHVRRLRQRLEEHHVTGDAIVTVRAVGYRFDAQVVEK